MAFKGPLKNGNLKFPFVFAGHQVSSCYEEGSGIFDPIYGKGEKGNDVGIISGPGQSLMLKWGLIFLSSTAVLL